MRLRVPQSGQLLAFGRFRTKDPFAQQLKLACAGAACGSDDGPTGATTTHDRRLNGAGEAVLRASAPRRRAGVPGPCDGDDRGDLCQRQLRERPGRRPVPKADPVFTLVSLTATTAKIGIAGGSLESGSQTVTLKKNKPVTLMNTADGTRYVLRLVSTS